MSAKPDTNDSETDFNNDGEPVAIDYLLSSDLPHAEGEGDDDEQRFGGATVRHVDDVDGFGDLDGGDDLPEDFQAAPAPAPAPVKRGRPRQGYIPPAPPTVDADGKPLTVYQRLVDYNLLRKITDIVMAKVAIPWHLRADATQEVHVAWAMLTAKPEFERNQLARYAYMSGQHAALKLRRTIGAVVTIPGALFRTGRDSAFMESIGAAVNPKDVEDYKDSLELSTEPVDDLHMSRVNDSLFSQRLGDLNLSTKQTLVARKALVERMAADDIAEELGMDLMYVERLLNQVTQKLLAKDGGELPSKPARKPRKAADVKAAKAAKAAPGTDDATLEARLGLPRGALGNDPDNINAPVRRRLTLKKKKKAAA